MAVTVRGKLPPGSFITCVGRKGSGKSFLGERLWLSYPGDRMVIDPTRDVSLSLPDGSFRMLPTPPPATFPKIEDADEQSSWLYVPSRRDPNYLLHMDSVVGLCLDNYGTCLWIDEVGRLAKRDRTPPRMSEALEEGRHRGLTLIMCGPRPVDIDPLVIAQSDYIYIFDLPQPVDRQRLASVMGYDTDSLSDAILALPEHGYLRFDARASLQSGQRLVEFPPLPRGRRAAGTPQLTEAR